MGSFLTRLLPWGVLTLFLIMWHAEPQFLQSMRLKVFDLYQQTWPREESGAPVYVIDIDEKSLEELGQWPWPRDMVAELVDKSFAAGAKALAFDIVFAEKDRTSPGVVSQNWPLEEGIKQRIANLPSNDKAFIDTVNTVENVVLGFAWDFNQPEQVDPDMELYSTVTGFDVEKAKEWVPRAPYAVRNIEEIEYAAPSIGWFGYIPDIDNIVRKVPMLMRHGDVLYAPLSLELLKLYLGGHTTAIEPAFDENIGITGVYVGDFMVPTDANGFYWIHFRPYSRSNYISAFDIINGDSEALAKLEDAMLLVGTSAKGLHDLRTTPLNANVPGVEVHAQILESVMADDYLQRPTWLKDLEFYFVLISGVLLIILMEWFGAVKAAMAAGVVMGSILAAGVWFFVSKGLLIDTVYPFITLVSVFIVHNVVKYAKEESSRRAIRDAFGHYLSPEMVKILGENPDSLRLGGEEKDLTILFSDIRSFTSLSEGFSAEELTAFINEYLTPMTNAVLQHKGTIDKYIGDALMAFWNAPLDVERHQYQACQSALTMIECLGELNTHWEQNGQPKIDIGIGIHSGIVSVGNMGSDQRFDYSVLGDNVNLASRLEGLCKPYGVAIVVSDKIKEAVPEGLFLPLDLVVVKGKTEPVEVFELISIDQHKKDDVEQVRIAEQAVLAFRTQKWDECQNMLNKLKGHTKLKDMYAARIKDFKASPPPADWNGAVERDEK